MDVQICDDGFEQAASAESLWASKAVKSRDLHATERQRLDEIVDAEVIHVGHAGIDALAQSLGARSVATEHAAAEAVVRGVDKLEHLLVAGHL